MSAVSGFRQGLHTWLLGGYRRYLQARRILNRCKNPLRVLVYGFLLVYVVWFFLSLYYTRMHVYHIQHQGIKYELRIQTEMSRVLNFPPFNVPLFHRAPTVTTLSFQDNSSHWEIEESDARYFFMMNKSVSDSKSSLDSERGFSTKKSSGMHYFLFY
jgi:hypothetical protein